MRSLSNTMKALSHLEVCWLLDGMTLGNPKSKPNLGLRQLLQRDHGGGDGHHHPLGGAGLLVDVVQGGTGGDGGQESGEGEQVHLHPVDDVTTHQSLSFSLKSNKHVARLLFKQRRYGIAFFLVAITLAACRRTITLSRR